MSLVTPNATFDLDDFKAKHGARLPTHLKALVGVYEQHLAAARSSHNAGDCKNCKAVRIKLGFFAMRDSVMSERVPDHQQRVDAEHATAVEEDLKDPDYARRAQAEHESAVAADQAAYDALTKQHAEESVQHAEFYKTGRAPMVAPSKPKRR